MSNLAKAIALAATAFENKFDKAGQPYILHCLRVMNAVETEELKIVAVLHDLIEDTNHTSTSLLEHGFKSSTVFLLEILTHYKEFSYDDYIKRISMYPDAVKVKLADLKDNSDITRLKGLTKKDFERMEKYHKAYTYLSKI